MSKPEIIDPERLARGTKTTTVGEWREALEEYVHCGAMERLPDGRYLVPDPDNAYRLFLEAKRPQ